MMIRKRDDECAVIKNISKSKNCMIIVVEGACSFDDVDPKRWIVQKIRRLWRLTKSWRSGAYMVQGQDYSIELGVARGNT